MLSEQADAVDIGSPDGFMLFGQTFNVADLLTIAILVVLESALSIDNALVLGVMAQRVEPGRRGKVLFYGLAGALVLRVAAISMAAPWVQRRNSASATLAGRVSPTSKR